MPCSVCSRIDLVKFNSKKGQGSIWLQRKYRKVEFGVERYVILVMEKGKIVKTGGIEPPSCKVRVHYKVINTLNIRGRYVFNRDDKINSVKEVCSETKENSDVKFALWGFSWRIEYLCSVFLKIFSIIY